MKSVYVAVFSIVILGAIYWFSGMPVVNYYYDANTCAVAKETIYCIGIADLEIIENDVSRYIAKNNKVSSRYAWRHSGWAKKAGYQRGLEIGIEMQSINEVNMWWRIMNFNESEKKLMASYLLDFVNGAITEEVFYSLKNSLIENKREER